MNRRTVVAQAPGRINIIGEHTDYNGGLVLPAAIDKSIRFRLSLNGTPTKVNFRAENVREDFSFDISSFAPIASGWPNYVMGVVYELQQRGALLQGFDAQFEGDLPIGSGMSSSAALECSLATGLNELFNLGLGQWQLIKVSQMAEHNFVGIKCGIMDQFSSVMGRGNQVMLLDCRSLEFQYFPFDLGEYQLLLLNTNVSHSLASSEYNTRRSECEEGVAFLQKYYDKIITLRDVSYDQLEARQADLPAQIFRRCLHVVTENQRVLAATKALTDKDFYTLGKLIYQSHYSLQHNYEVSCRELDFLVEYTRSNEEVLGARMMGGGFGGCTINIIKKSKVQEFVAEVSYAYKERFDLVLIPYEISVSNGARIIK